MTSIQPAAAVHSEVVVIHGVFDVQHGHWGRGGPKKTSLGVNASGARHYNLVLNGWQDIQRQRTVTAFFRKPDDWKQLVGWIDHDSGEVIAAFPEASWWAVGVAGLLVVAWFSFLLQGHWLLNATPGVQAGLLLGTAALCLLVGHMTWRTRRTEVERALLEDCRLSMRGTPAGKNWP